MRAVIAVLALLALGAVAQDTKDYDLWTGYEMNTEVKKAGGIFYIKIAIKASEIGANGTETMLKVVANSASSTSKGGKVTYYFKMGAKPTIQASGGDTAVFTKATTDVGEITFSRPITMAGDYYLAGQVECGTCASTGEYRVGVWITHRAPGTTIDVVQPFALKDDSYTADFHIKANEYGASGYLDVTTGMNYFVKVDLQDLSNSGSIIVVYKKGELPLASEDAKTKTEVAGMWYKYPTGSTQAGDFSTGARMLDAGRWYIALYAANVPTGLGALEVDFAVGFGHEPAGAGMVVPSMAVLFVLATSLLAYFL
jgi:hypothetical protein